MYMYMYMLSGNIYVYMYIYMYIYIMLSGKPMTNRHVNNEIWNRRCRYRCT